LSHAEVHQSDVDDITFEQHDVLRLDVPVHHPAFVRMIESAAELRPRLQELGVTQTLFPIKFTEGLALNVLGKEKRLVRLSDHLVDRQDDSTSALTSTTLMANGRPIFKSSAR